ncbi:hypothetical protein [Pseudomonas sp. AM8]|uniref:hypothetical protein n=1 Tax=Pseudomonas sp. AM8 TaxID=2983368 RepID=UPI002E7FBC6D|nr:hypothetical protein [Pseudomonas sp. AM8]
MSAISASSPVSSGYATNNYASPKSSDLSGAMGGGDDDLIAQAKAVGRDGAMKMLDMKAFNNVTSAAKAVQ